MTRAATRSWSFGSTRALPLRRALVTRPWIALALIVAVGAVLRVWGILHGLREGFVYHPDAGAAVHDVWHHYLGAPWGQSQFGATYNVLVVSAMSVVEGVARLAGYPPEWSFELIATTSSLVTATLGTLTILATYWLGARAYDRSAGILAAAFLSVDPLHSFQSHYPYRDVPMTFFLTLTLVACVAVAARPTAAAFLGAGIGAGITAALKPAGLAVGAPVLAAVALALIRVRRLWVVIGAALLLVVALIGLPMFRGNFAPPWTVARNVWSTVTDYFLQRGMFSWNTVALVPGLAVTFKILVHWVGLPYVLAASVGIGFAAWRWRVSDIPLMAFVIPALLAAALYIAAEERFLVFLLPPLAVLVARVVVQGWRASAQLGLARGGVVLLVAGLLVSALYQSVWQGILMTLPDTRLLAGRWLEAHVPPTANVAVEGYYPLGVERWPNVAFFDSAQPFRGEAAKARLLITSTLEHQRYLDAPERYPQRVAFFKALRLEAPLIKTFALTPLGFAHSTISVYSTALTEGGPPPELDMPRPYDHAWNAGVSFLDTSPYDRDDRTIWLSGAQRYAATLVSARPVDEMAVFVLNGPDPSLLRVRVAWSSKTRALAPGEWRVLRFRPTRIFPMRPALYGFELGLVHEGTQALVQLRSGAREIGETYGRWGRWDAAIPYLERAVAASPSDAEGQLLLARAYEQEGRLTEARRTVARLATEAPEFVEGSLELGRAELSAESWARSFRAISGLEPSLLTSALTWTFEAEHLVLRYGRVLRDLEASGGLAVAFREGQDRAGIVVEGPYVHRLSGTYLAPGTYRARFAIRASDPVGMGTAPVAILRVVAGGHVLGARAVTARDLGLGGSIADVPVAFEHTDQILRVSFQVEATGVSSFAVDTVRVEPDLREAFRQRALMLEALGLPNPWAAPLEERAEEALFVAPNRLDFRWVRPTLSRHSP